MVSANSRLLQIVVCAKVTVLLWGGLTLSGRDPFTALTRVVNGVN